LDADLATIAEIRAHPKENNNQLSFGFGLEGFNDVAWKTAQNTGAMAYMPYQRAKIYSEIYDTQQEVYSAEKLVVDDVMRAAAFPSTQGKDWRPTPQQCDELTNRIGELRMRLMLLNSLVNSLDHTYRSFQTGEH
jgi:hypothetical protein